MLDDFDRLPSDVRARIEQALVQAERTLTAAEAEPAVVESFRGGFIARLYPGADRLVPTVVDVVAVIVETLGEHARAYHWSASRLRSTAEHAITVTSRYLFEQFRLQRPAPFEAFRDKVLSAAHALPGWLAFLQVLEERSVAVIPVGVQLQEQLDDLGWTPTEFAYRAKVDTRTVERQIAGTAKPRRENIRQYETILSEEKQEAVRFILPPKRRKTPAKRRRKRR